MASLSADGHTPGQASERPDVLDTTAAGRLVIRGGTLRFGSYVGVVALSVVSAALLTRHLGPAHFSQYTTVLSLVSVVAVVTDAGMANLGTREFAVRSGGDRDALMRDLLSLRVALTAIGVVLAMAFAFAAHYDTALLAGTFLASVATVALVLQHTLSIPLSAELRLGALSLLELARQALTVAAIVVLIALGAGVFPLLAVTLLVNALLLLPSAALVRGRISLRIELRPRRWASLLRLTVVFALATAVGTIYVYAVQIITSLVASPQQSGLFAASFRVFVVTAGVPGLLVSGALPLLARAARDDRDRLAYATARIFEVSLILGVGAAVGLLGGAQFVIAVVAGPKYAGAGEVLEIQGLATMFSFVLAGWTFALISLKRYRGLLTANAAALLVSCILAPTLASTDGAQGAALATVCAEATLGLGTLIALVRRHPHLRPPLAVVPKVALAAAPAVVLAVVPDLTSLLRGLLAVGVYGLLITLTRAVPKELTEPLTRFRRAGNAPADLG